MGSAARGLAWMLAVLAVHGCASHPPTEPEHIVPGHPLGESVSSLALANGPWGVAISSQNLAYVSRPLTDSITRIDLASNAIDGSFSVGNRPDDICFDAAGATAYVTNLDDGTVGVVSTSSSMQTAIFPVPGGPLRVRLGPQGAKLYVTLDNGNLVVLDARTGALRTTQTLGAMPNGMALTSNGSRLYVSATEPGTVTEINTVSDDVMRSFVIGGTPQDVVVSPDDATLYVANEAGWVAVWDINAWSRRDSIAVAGAFGLALSPDGVQLWVTETPQGVVAVIDRATGGVIRAINTLGRPRHIAFTTDGTAALLANEAGFVQIIR